jgi:tetratricopeptide (TPR) repeat protein
MEWQTEPQFNVAQLEALTRQAVVTSPDQPNVWLGLSHAFLKGGHYREAVDFLEPAVARFPASSGLRLHLAQAKLQLGEFEDALDHVGRVLRREPENANARVLQFELLFRTAQWTRVEELADQLACLNALNPYLYEVWGRQVGTPADAQRLLERCDAALATGALCTNAVYYKAVALGLLGRNSDAREVLSIEQFVRVGRLALPEGFGSQRSFRAALNEEILNHPTLSADPRGKATRGGRQTRGLMYPEAIAIPELMQQIRAAVDRYSDRLPARSSLALVRPKKVRLVAWAVVYGGEGRQESHRHPGGWISGVYYVSAERPAGQRNYRGALQLGVLPTAVAMSPPWGMREIEPVPGRLVLFPSYVPHATMPPGMEGARVSVAFDVLPAD